MVRELDEPGIEWHRDRSTRPTVELRVGSWPSVGVVITTRNRPNLVRRALASITAQDYPGKLRIVVVFDGTMPDWSLFRGGTRPVLVLANWRTPGPPGARNTGILAVADCDWVALCDDEDTWAPAKLTAQVSALRDRPESAFGTCAAEIEYAGQRVARRVGAGPVTLADVTLGRARALAASSFLARTEALLRSARRGGVGLLDEHGPRGAAEWDLLMRAARRAPIVHLDAPLVRLLWHPPAADPVDALRVLRWMNARHAEIRDGPRPAARNLAETACWEALAGNRALSWTLARAACRTCPVEPLAIVALAAAAGLARGRRLRAILSRDLLIRP